MPLPLRSNSPSRPWRCTVGSIVRRIADADFLVGLISRSAVAPASGVTDPRGRLRAFFTLLHNAEEIAVRIFEDDEVGTVAVAPGIPASAQSFEPHDFPRLIIGIQIQVDPVAAGPLRLAGLKRYVRILPAGIAKYAPAVA